MEEHEAQFPIFYQGLPNYGISMKNRLLIKRNWRKASETVNRFMMACAKH
jgi:hypothetical protein